MLLWHIFLESSRGANVSAVTFHHIALGHQVICSSYAKLIEENFLNQQIVFFLETSSFKVELVSLNPSQIVFHSSINNLYYYNKTTSFQPLFIEYCIRLPLCTSSSPLFLTRLCELCPTSPGCDSPTQSRSLLCGWPWLWDSGVPWASPTHAHMHTQKCRETSGRWGLAGEVSLLPQEDCFEMRVLHSAEGGLMKSSKHSHWESLSLTFALLAFPSPAK